MNKRLMKAIFLLSLIVSMVSSEALGEGHEEWREKACLTYDCKEYEMLGELAQKNNIFLAGNVYEVDPNFTDLYFQTCFIIGPNGDVILRYRRLSSSFEATPHDVWDKYLDKNPCHRSIQVIQGLPST